MYDARLTVKQSAHVTWGADIGFRRVSLAGLRMDGSFELLSATVPSKDEIAEAETFRRLFEAAQMLGQMMLEIVGPASTILVERPAAGGRVSQEMHYSFALVSAALESVDGGLVSWVIPGTWKKRSVGHGRAEKADILAWAQEFGYAGRSQDEADALGIAYAARELTTVG